LFAYAFARIVFAIAVASSAEFKDLSVLKKKVSACVVTLFMSAIPPFGNSSINPVRVNSNSSSLFAPSKPLICI
jgi:hypothetical protein